MEANIPLADIRDIICDAMLPVFASAKGEIPLPSRILRTVDSDTIRDYQEQLIKDQEYSSWYSKYITEFTEDSLRIPVRMVPPERKVHQTKGPRYFFNGDGKDHRRYFWRRHRSKLWGKT